MGWSNFFLFYYSTLDCFIVKHYCLIRFTFVCNFSYLLLTRIIIWLYKKTYSKNHSYYIQLSIKARVMRLNILMFFQIDPLTCIYFYELGLIFFLAFLYMGLSQSDVNSCGVSVFMQVDSSPFLFLN
jgi:hypothetical protein